MIFYSSLVLCLSFPQPFLSHSPKQVGFFQAFCFFSIPVFPKCHFFLLCCLKQALVRELFNKLSEMSVDVDYLKQCKTNYQSQQCTEEIQIRSRGNLAQLL